MTCNQPAGARLFAAMTTDDIGVYRADLAAARAKQARAYGHGTPERAVYTDTCGLLDDLHKAWEAAFTREAGAQRAAEIRRAVHLGSISEAERLLAAERAA
jgi:hypothetical protein